MKSSASARHKAAAGKKTSGGKGKVRSIEFERVDGGFISRTRHEGGNGEYMEPKTTIHPSIAHAKSHLQTSMTDLNDDFDAKGDES